MKFEIRGENVETTQAIENYIKDKIGKVEKYFENDEIENAIAHVNYEVHNKETDMEITIPLKNVTLRAEESHNDLYAAVDLIVEKLERQVRKYKTRIKRDKRREAAENKSIPMPEINEDHSSDEEIQIVKSKHFNLKPMNEIEAVLQMDLLNHDFFIFTSDKDDKINIVYKRKDGKYGLIEVE